MTDIIYPVDERKPSLDASDAAELVRAKGSRSRARLKALLAFHQKRGVPDRDIVAAMAASPCLVDALGRGRRRP